MLRIGTRYFGLGANHFDTGAKDKQIKRLLACISHE